MKKVDVNAAVAAKLARAQKRREELYAKDRIVYAYARNGLSDNLILLPRSTEKGHAAFLEMQIASIIQSGFDTNKVKGFQILRIGIFNKSTYNFKKVRPVCVLKIDDVIKKVNEIKEGSSNG